jgi:N-acylneuraminate cytidylyltransferase
MRYLAVIPARGGSKGIPHKNRKLLHGKPLIEYTIDAVKASCVPHACVSTDDPMIADIANALGIRVIMRPPELAQDDTPTLPVLEHAVRMYGEVVDAVVMKAFGMPLPNLPTIIFRPMTMPKNGLLKWGKIQTMSLMLDAHEWI